MSRYSETDYCTDRIFQAIHRLNTGKTYPIGLGTEDGLEYPLQYRWQNRMIWANIEKCSRLPDDVLLGAIAHEYAHGETHCMKFGNPYENLSITKSWLIQELQDLLERLRRDWQNEDTCQLITGCKTPAYDLPMNNCIEGRAGELISKLKAQDDGESRWWLENRLPLYIRTMKYYACGRHNLDFNQFNFTAAFVLQLKAPLRLGIDDVEWFEEVF